MLIAFRDLSAVKKNVEVEVPSEQVERELDAVTAEFARHAKIPGFREGKVPLGVVRTKFQKEIRDEVIQRLLPKYFYEVVEEKGLETVGSPYLKRVDELIVGAPFKFEAEFEVKPEVTLGEYRGLEVREVDTAVSDEDVERMIERLRDQGSTFRPIEDRGAEEDDYVIFDITMTAEGMEPRKSESAHVRIGEETPLPELHEALRGKKPGDTATVSKSWAEDAADEEIRGKDVTYEMVVKEIRVRERPELTDEFAKSAGWESVDDLRQKLQADMQRHREADAIRAKRQEIGEKLVELHAVETPETMVENELGNAMRNYARYLASQGVDLEKAEIDWNKVRDEFRSDAEKRARRALILEAIGKKENLTVSDAEVDAEIRKASADARREFAEVKHRLKHEGEYEQLRLSLLQEKALDFVLAEARSVAAPAAEPRL
jgi:trigger factor